jgi:hypothetical protein
LRVFERESIQLGIEEKPVVGCHGMRRNENLRELYPKMGKSYIL